jgi:hypothetical protein
MITRKPTDDKHDRFAKEQKHARNDVEQACVVLQTHSSIFLVYILPNMDHSHHVGGDDFLCHHAPHDSWVQAWWSVYDKDWEFHGELIGP